MTREQIKQIWQKELVEAILRGYLVEEKDGYVMTEDGQTLVDEAINANPAAAQFIKETGYDPSGVSLALLLLEMRKVLRSLQ